MKCGNIIGMTEDKHEKFLRLGKLRGERVLKDVRLVANLSNTKNYEYKEEEVRRLFSAIEEEVKIAKNEFLKNAQRSIKL